MNQLMTQKQLRALQKLKAALVSLVSALAAFPQSTNPEAHGDFSGRAGAGCRRGKRLPTSKHQRTSKFQTPTMLASDWSLALGAFFYLNSEMDMGSTGSLPVPDGR
ncbi:MAG: hypothetical protein ABUL66_01555 [Verrucomicrobiota bacterium]